MTEVPVIVHELLRAAAGHPITVRTLDGDEVVLRLATADELLRFEQEARASLVARGMAVDHPSMSRDRAEELCAPLSAGGPR